MYGLMRNVMNSHEVGKRELCETNVISIPTPGLGRLRVCGLASQSTYLRLLKFPRRKHCSFEAITNTKMSVGRDSSQVVLHNVLACRVFAEACETWGLGGG